MKSRSSRICIPSTSTSMLTRRPRGVTGRARRRGIELDVSEVGLGDATPADADLFYIGGGQDREQALIAPDLAARGAELSEAVAGGAVVLAVCGGYQLLGRYYRDRWETSSPAPAFPAAHGGRRPAPHRRRAASSASSSRESDGRSSASRTTAAGRFSKRARCRSAGSWPASETTGVRLRGLPRRQRHRHVSPRPAAAANPRLADWLLASAVEHRTGERPLFESLPDGSRRATTSQGPGPNARRPAVRRALSRRGVRAADRPPVGRRLGARRDRAASSPTRTPRRLQGAVAGRGVGLLADADALKALYVGGAGVVWALGALGRRGHAESELDLPGPRAPSSRPGGRSPTT